jgi:16S rRNA (cytidine1402-2'-O)-methyltransferase
VDAVACEDTRVSAGLLRHLGLHKPLIALHQHNEHEAAEQVVERLSRGEKVAYLSDAGTPAVSDPGAVLVAAVSAAGLRVLPIPGASSVVTALSTSGDAAASGFRFVGFLPSKAQERRAVAQQLVGQPCSQVLFEAPHRIQALVALLAELCPEQNLTLCRELTKQFETVHTAKAGAMPAWLAADAQRERGEFVLVLHAAPTRPSDAELPELALRALEVLSGELPLKQAVALAAELSGASRNRLYERALELKNAREG